MHTKESLCISIPSMRGVGRVERGTIQKPLFKAGLCLKIKKKKKKKKSLSEPIIGYKSYKTIIIITFILKQLLNVSENIV